MLGRKLLSARGGLLGKHGLHRCFAASPDFDLTKARNIGISAHIDSGKTTLTERILFFTGRINAIHDVRGKDGVGAKMDSMDLEREKGITIQSAATFCHWGENHVNIIDTPGHVDFTIEVERALRVLDGAIAVFCGVSGVQSQSITVDRQMKRYNVPRVAFINKMDRTGVNPFGVVEKIRKMLALNAAAIQIPVGMEEHHIGVIDIIGMKMLINIGEEGETVEVSEIPEEHMALALEKRSLMLECLAEVDDEIADIFLMEEEPEEEMLKAAIRRATIAREFVPVFMGSAFKNKGVQQLLDGVIEYLPSPPEVSNFALQGKEEERVELPTDPSGPMVGLAFKLEEGRFGQLTYMRIYSGTLKKGDFIHNVRDGKKVKVPRLVRMHSADMEDVDSAGAGDVVAMFGVDCASMDTFTDGKSQMTMTSMFVPPPVMSLAVKPKSQKDINNFSKALQKFMKEDPTFKVQVDPISNETVISGMGELHLDVYCSRMQREYDCEVEVGAPQVNYKESINARHEFNHLHKKQTGGSGQYARVVGYVEPLTDEERAELMEEEGKTYIFQNDIVGNVIPPEFINACGKGTEDAVLKGPLTGHPLQGVRVVLTDGAAHVNDSSEMAFKIAMRDALKDAFTSASPKILEPVMVVEVEVPAEFQGTAIAGLNKRKGMIQSNEVMFESAVVRCDVPLANMFGYSTDLRSVTQGMGEFTMEYKDHSPVTRDDQKELVKKYQEENKR